MNLKGLYANSTPANSTFTSYPKMDRDIVVSSIQGNFGRLSLIIIVVVLGISLIASLFLHVYLWRMRRRQMYITRTLNASHAAHTTGITSLMLNAFPLHPFQGRSQILSDLPLETEKKKKKTPPLPSLPLPMTNMAPSSSCTMIVQEPSASLSSSPTLQKVPPDVLYPLDDSETHTLSQDLLSDETETLNDSCPVCIEAFNSQDCIRTLPCRHSYHPSCIDPWLISKDTTCPLCKFDVKIWSTQATSRGADPAGPLLVCATRRYTAASTSQSPPPA